MTKRYRLETNCPQCGCSAVSHLTEDEIRAKFGEVPNVGLECGECMAKYEAEMAQICPEWDQECRLRKK